MSQTAQTVSRSGAPSPDISVRSPSRSELEAAVAPFVIEKFAADDARWRKLVAAQERKWRRKRIGQRWFGWAPALRRDQSSVRAKYDRIWEGGYWPETFDATSDHRTAHCSWGSAGYHLRYGGTKRAHHVVLAEIFDAIKPQTVLEVGCGTGFNLFVLASEFPGVSWAGGELTATGVTEAKAAQAADVLPKSIADFAVRPVIDDRAYRSIDFRIADARALPFDDDSFDLVFSCQALEQMQAIRDEAVSEMARVARSHVVMCEPLAEFNTSQTRRSYIETKSYLDLSLSELPRFGIHPFFQFGDVPHKLVMGVGLMAATVDRR